MKQTMFASADHMSKVAASLNVTIVHFNSGLIVAKKHGWEDRIAHYQARIDKLTAMRDNWTKRANTIRAQAALMVED